MLARRLRADRTPASPPRPDGCRGPIRRWLGSGREL